jgi:DNA-binding transcriptional ArsR family regulator
VSSSEETKRRDRRKGQPDFVTAINHPLRVKLLATLATREASPSELAKEFEEDLGVINYHARKLEKLGMVEVVRERPVRGSTEHFYKSTTRPWWTTEQWSRVDPKLKSVTTTWILDRLIEDAATALNGGTFDRRDERHLSRTPMVLDQQGWMKLSAILDETLDAILQESAQATERMAESGEGPIPLIIGMLAFEMPPGHSSPDQL